MKVNATNEIVKITARDGGEIVDEPVWCLVVRRDGSPRTFCTGEVFGYGEGDAIYKRKQGLITCESCKELVREIKAVRL